MKQIRLTNVRTLLQFSQYREVIRIEYNGNKLMAMNAIRSGYGVKQFSVLNEYRVNNYLPEGSHIVL